VVARARPRARHDAGLEPFDWVRISLVLTLVVVSSGAALTVAGLLREGPLRDIGWADRRLEGFDVEHPPVGAREIVVNAVGVPTTACTLEVRVEVRETRDAVVLGPVHSREPRLPFTAPGCAGGVVRDEGRVRGVVRLDAPLDGRRIVRAADSLPVRQLEPASTPSAATASATPSTTPVSTSTPTPTPSGGASPSPTPSPSGQGG
jgi:hypothetical protein